MSYTTINGMRSARYPLQDCGCGCSGGTGCGPSLRGEAETESIKTAAASGGMFLLLGIGGLVLWGMSGSKKRGTA